MRCPMVSLFELNYKYIIDTSAILTQKDDEKHSRKVFGGLWNNIDSMIKRNEIVTCSEIALEVEDDSLKPWMKQIETIGIDDDIQELVKKVVTTNKQLVDFKKNKSSGDAFLIATALKHNLVVIAEEDKKSPKKIPQTCNMLGLECVNIVELCEREGWSF